MAMDRQKLKTIQKHISRCLESGSISSGMVVYETVKEQLDLLLQVIPKEKSKYINLYDLFHMLNDAIEFALDIDIGHDYRIIELVDRDKIETISKKIIDFISSLPKAYNLYYRVHTSRPLENDIIFSDDIALVSRSFGSFRSDYHFVPGLNVGERARRGLMGGYVDEGPEVYLQIKSTGYVGEYLVSSADRDGLHKIKQFYALCDIYAFASRSYMGKHAFGYAYYTAFEEGINTNPVNKSMDYNLSAMLFKTNLLIDKIEDSNNNNDIGMECIKYLLSDLNNNKDCENIKSALVWYFDAYSNGNDTIEFMQTCIALEALLGEDDLKQNLTVRLGDRCAFLVGRNQSERKIIMDDFESIYNMRSKLVHGRKIYLDEAEMEVKFKAQSLLEMLIRKDLMNLNLSKKTKGNS